MSGMGGWGKEKRCKCRTRCCHRRRWNVPVWDPIQGTGNLMNCNSDSLSHRLPMNVRFHALIVILVVAIVHYCDYYY